MKNKFYYIGLNFVVPGMGQLSAKRYFRGIIQALFAVGAIVWLIWEVMMPFINFYKGDPLESKLPEIEFISVLMPILLFIAVLLWSIVDLMFGFKENNCEEKDGED